MARPCCRQAKQGGGPLRKQERLGDDVTIVTGLPRSGTSMMMRMLEAGGLPVLTDKVRTADDDNPEGYYEYERVKQIEEDRAWLDHARGRSVKMVSALLEYLPPTYHYKVVFMRRDMDEILASQRKMLDRLGESRGEVDDATMARLFAQHLAKVTAWLERQPNIDVLYVSYNDVLADPRAQAARLDRFFGGELDVAAMVSVVDPDLYRNRLADTEE
jgi:hypothetical protein